MQKFKELVLADDTGLLEEAVEKLEEYAQAVKVYGDVPADEEELYGRIRTADGILLSYKTPLPGNVIRKCPNLKYIGLCCTIVTQESSNVDILAAKEQGITVTGVRDYGDQGVVDFVAANLLSYLHGWGGKQWKSHKTELTDVPVGIIGFGTTGQMVARALKLFGARIFYYSRTRKPEAEKECGAAYLGLHDLLKKTEIISTHLPKFTSVMGREEFELFGPGKILVNTSLGPVFDVDAMESWLSDPSNTYICDQCGMGGLEDKLRGENVLFLDQVCAKTCQLDQRLSEKALDNIRRYKEEIK